MVQKLKNAGIKLGIGTDLVIGWFRWLPDAYLAELKSFLKIGYSIPEVLVIATKTNAEILDMDDKLGTKEANSRLKSDHSLPHIQSQYYVPSILVF